MESHNLVVTLVATWEKEFIENILVSEVLLVLNNITIFFTNLKVGNTLNEGD